MSVRPAGRGFRTGGPVPGRGDRVTAGPVHGPERGSSADDNGLRSHTMTDTPDRPTDEPTRPDGQLVELAGRRRVAPDELTVAHRARAPGRWCSATSGSPTPRPTSPARCADRSPARSRSAAGPAVVVFAGDVFDLRDGTDVESALLAHPRLVGGAGDVRRRRRSPAGRAARYPRQRARARSPRDRRGRRARWRGRARRACSRSTPESAAGSCTSSPVIGSIRPPRSPIRAIPTIVRSRSTSCARSARASRARQGSSAWLAGIDDLVDRSQAGAFVASRLAYRRLLRRSGWLIIPALVGLALFWSFFELTGRRTQRQPARARDPAARRRPDARARGRRGRARVHDHAAARTRSAASRGGARSRAATTTRAARPSRSRRPAASGWSPRTRAGPSSPISVADRSTRTAAAAAGSSSACPRAPGFPPVFVERLRCSWVELEAGAELHARLWHGVRDLPSSTWIERIAARERVKPSWPPDGRRAASGHRHLAVGRRRDRGPPAHPPDRGDRDRVRRRDQPRVGGDPADREPARRAPPVRADRGSRSRDGARRARRASACCSSRGVCVAVSGTRGRWRSRCCSSASPATS